MSRVCFRLVSRQPISKPVSFFKCLEEDSCTSFYLMVMMRMVVGGIVGRMVMGGMTGRKEGRGTAPPDEGLGIISSPSSPNLESRGEELL